CVLFVSSLDPMAGPCGHLIDVLVLVLHGCVYGRVSHDAHDRKQVSSRAIHLSSEAVTRAVEDEVAWQPSLLPGFLELFSDRCQMPTRSPLGRKYPSLLLLRSQPATCCARSPPPRFS